MKKQTKLFDLEEGVHIYKYAKIKIKVKIDSRFFGFFSDKFKNSDLFY